jgi:Chalcone isomerase-like
MLLLIASALAGSLAGVTLPDTATVGGQTVSLNGIGLREKLYIDIYVGALYLQTKTTSASAAIAADEPKKITMHFIYKEVTRDQLVETFNEGFSKQGAAATAQKANTDKLISWLPAAVKAGEKIEIEYAPGTGTTFKINGSSKGTIAGADFMKLIWTIYLGPNPPTADLKKGMLGG